MGYIPGNLESVVKQVTEEYPVVLVTGPRQVGKTTMLKKMMEGTDRDYVSLDDLNERGLAKSDPELFTYIKIHVDTNRKPGALQCYPCLPWSRRSCAVLRWLLLKWIWKR